MRGTVAFLAGLALLAAAAFGGSGPAPADGPISVLNYHANADAQRVLVDDLAAEQGWAVTHAGPEAFAALSESEVRAYDVLLIASAASGDAPCGSDQWMDVLDFRGLLANPHVGAATREGRKVLTSLDPDWHAAELFGQPERFDARTLLRNMVVWVGEGASVGYVALSDGSYCGTWWTEPGSFVKALLNPPAAGFEYGSALESAFLVGAHPIRQDLPPVLDWGHHGQFLGPVPGFAPLAIDPASGLATLEVQDGPPPNAAPRILEFLAGADVEGNPSSFHATAVDDDGDTTGVVGFVTIP